MDLFEGLEVGSLGRDLGGVMYLFVKLTLFVRYCEPRTVTHSLSCDNYSIISMFDYWK